MGPSIHELGHRVPAAVLNWAKVENRRWKGRSDDSETGSSSVFAYERTPGRGRGEDQEGGFRPVGFPSWAEFDRSFDHAKGEVLPAGASRPSLALA